jgi:hypothetical protein
MGSAAVISIFRTKVAELKDTFEASRVSENAFSWKRAFAP